MGQREREREREKERERKRVTEREREKESQREGGERESESQRGERGGIPTPSQNLYAIQEYKYVQSIHILAYKIMLLI